ncbi:hypothetical protein ARMSODRAFT_1022391 [Armillaria solidipes]|uniref:Uncharacterized protein n=1 Tax=Armillaria solidipes TaxID=1076256 RepID=A0A2H3BE08_9AGAR|nr:hypothetical protein ARMSODRAFT_1022391 [Armillaria solidipes]
MVKGQMLGENTRSRTHIASSISWSSSTSSQRLSPQLSDPQYQQGGSDKHADNERYHDGSQTTRDGVVTRAISSIGAQNGGDSNGDHHSGGDALRECHALVTVAQGAFRTRKILVFAVVITGHLKLRLQVHKEWDHYISRTIQMFARPMFSTPHLDPLPVPTLDLQAEASGYAIVQAVSGRSLSPLISFFTCFLSM